MYAASMHTALSPKLSLLLRRTVTQESRDSLSMQHVIMVPLWTIPSVNLSICQTVIDASSLLHSAVFVPPLPQYLRLSSQLSVFHTVCMSVCQTVCLPYDLLAYLSDWLSSIRFACLFVRLSASSIICLYICPTLCLACGFNNLPVYLSDVCLPYSLSLHWSDSSKARAVPH